MDSNIKTTLGDDGVLLAVIDMPGRSMNVFSLDMMNSLEKLLEHVESTGAVKSVVITSGKQAFLAGADLDMIRMFTERARTGSYDELHDLFGRLGRLFRRLEKSPKPYVAAVNGLALGGGLELSMACHERVLSNDRGVLVGLPEIKLGLLPGAGGTQRLPRLVGTALGMKMLLIGDPLTAAQALECGLAHELAAPVELVEAAKRRARALAQPKAPWDRPAVTFNAAPFDFSRADAHAQITQAVGISDYQVEHYPAYKAILNCVVGGWNKPMDEAGHWEMDCFVELLRDPVAGNMVRTLFLDRQRAAKLAPSRLKPAEVKVSIVGEGAPAVQKMLESGKAPIAPADDLGAGDIALLLPGATAGQGIKVAWLTEAAVDRVAVGARAGVWLSDATDQGRTLEVHTPVPDALATDAGIVLGRWLRANVLLNSGKTALLPRLKAVRALARQRSLSEADELLVVALAAAAVWGEGGIADTALADVGVVIGGLFPSYTGGPFNYLRQSGVENVRRRAAAATAANADLFALPAALTDFFAKLGHN
ncbi:MAG: enoyl-CoA hydratase/isomerase family protein [Rhodocyclaceae bacterium]|nr:enoyl-CoA hydratase/isomerase family protein [Rhodocyclaceae bacterium]